MMKNKFKGFITIITAVILCISTVGCSKTDPKNSDSGKTIPMGRYVEETLELPKSFNSEQFISLVKNNKEQIEVYTSNDEFSEVFKYTLNGTKWSREPQLWIKGDEMSLLSSIEIGEDGNTYLFYHDKDFISKVLKKIGEDTSEIMNLEGHDVKIDDMYPYAVTLKVLKNGNIAFSYFATRAGALYDGKTGKKINDIETGMIADTFKSPIDAFENSIVSLSDDLKNIIITDTENNNEKKEVSLDNLSTLSNNLFTDKDGTVYITNKEGVNQLPLGSTMWETIIEGSDTSFGLTEVTLNNFIKGNNDDYYGALIKTDYSSSIPNKIVHYFYDEAAKIETDTEIFIYSLVESSFIRQAVTKFNTENQNIKINYRVGMSNKGTTIADSIKALNTEILAGNGADILVLDGLNTDEYIKKGILKDICNVMKPKVEAGELLENIANDYIVNDKCYMMPSRFVPSIVFGKKGEALEATKSFTELSQYFNENSNKDIMVPMYRSCEELTYIFMINNYEYGFDIKNKSFDTDKFTQFLNEVKIIFNNVNQDLSKKEFISHLSKKIEDMLEPKGYYIFNWNNYSSVHINEGFTDIQYLGPLCLEGTFGMIDAVKNIKGGYIDVNNSYLSQCIIGINNTNDNIEYAEKFIDLLFSGDIQMIDTYKDGFPVNEKVIDLWPKKEIKEFSRFDFGTINDVAYTHEFNRPSESELQQLVDFCKTLEKPSQPDYIISDLILSELNPFFRDETTADETAEKVASKIELYFMEQ